MKLGYSCTVWALKWVQNNRLDGERESFVHFLLGDARRAGNSLATFLTRAEARAYAKGRFGYIRKRPDLRQEPHCWSVPLPVKIEVRAFEVEA